MPPPDPADRFDARLRAGGDPYAALEEILGGAAGRRARDAAGWVGGRRRGYYFRRLLGIGGMGATYAGVDAGGRAVALKVVPSLDDRSRARFETECRILKGLDHPGIVRYREHTLIDGDTGLLVMDLLEGTNLQSVLDALDEGARDQPVVAALTAGLPLVHALQDPGYQRRVLELVAAVADALHHAHEHGIVHRDVKPANILLDSRLRPRLIDFGLGLDLLRHRTLTHSGTTLGTLAYMAPEQLVGPPQAVDRRADVFSLGLVLYRCLVGRELREGVDQVVAGDRPRILVPHGRVAHLPRNLQAVLYKALEARPRARYATAAAFAADLRALLQGRALTTRLPSVVRRLYERRLRPRAGVLAILLLASGTIAAVWAATRPPAHVVTIDAFHDLNPCDVLLDGESTGLRLPLIDHPIDPGPHTVTYRVQDERTLPITQDFTVRGRHTRVTLLNVPSTWPHRKLYEGPEPAFLLVEAPEGAERTLDGRTLDPGDRWLAVRPGRHVVRATADGFTEEQELTLQAQAFNPVVLLGDGIGIAASERGAYRRTLGSLLSPFPDDVSLALGDHAVVLLNQDQDVTFYDVQKDDLEPGIVNSKGISGTHLATECYLTAAAAHRWAEAVLTVQFPQPVTRLRFQMPCYSANERADEELHLAFRTEATSWQRVPLGESRRHDRRWSGPATRWLKVRVRIRTSQPPHDYATAKAFKFTLDESEERVMRPGFAVVADP